MRFIRPGPALVALAWLLAGLVPALSARAAPPRQTPATYYVDSLNGDDAADGTSPATAWRTLARAAGAPLAPGDRLLLARGSTWNETLSLSASGTAAAPITVDAFGSGPPPLLFGLTLSGDHLIVQNLVIDHQRQSGDAVRLRGAQNAILRDLEIRDTASDCLDGDDADGVLLERLHIHHCLAGSFTNQVDAHGIVFTDTQGITIRGTEVHHVSGDSFQTDPDRDTDTPQDILIEDSHFWTGPLTEDFNAWRAGEVPGENAVDTKMVKSDWDAVPRMRITLRNVVAHGWVNDGFISNRAAFNMKEKIEALFDGVTVYDSEIAFRLRGTRGNADVTILNAVIYNVERAVRAEDNLANLAIYHTTFGGGIGTAFQIVAGNNSATWDLRNNAFPGAVPGVASDPSNLTATATDFVDAATHDYHLAPGAGLIDQGVPLTSVATDRDGRARPQGSAPDVGAYEFAGAAPTPGDVNGDGVVNVLDVQRCVNVVLGLEPDPAVQARADLNGDGTVNVLDVQGIINAVLSG